jgi:hypothetical protein
MTFWGGSKPQVFHNSRKSQQPPTFLSCARHDGPHRISGLRVKEDPNLSHFQENPLSQKNITTYPGAPEPGSLTTPVEPSFRIGGLAIRCRFGAEGSFGWLGTGPADDGGIEEGKCCAPERAPIPAEHGHRPRAIWLASREPEPASRAVHPRIPSRTLPNPRNPDGPPMQRLRTALQIFAQATAGRSQP